MTLLVKADKSAPDSKAVATLIEALNRFYDMKIDTSKLQKEKDRIHLEFSELSQKYVEHREETSGMYMSVDGKVDCQSSIFRVFFE